ncbi:MAG: hypothetical protein EHM21_17200 [Chloroflexi bacterium]|nr:MAG: hypothetical protein EHM21_17200 [Chloroflexota bacterium]
MTKNVRFAFLCILLPVMIAVFYFEAQMQVSPGRHKLVQLLIVTVAFWLAWRWVQFDWIYTLRENNNTEPIRTNRRILTRIEGNETVRDSASHASTATTGPASAQKPVPTVHHDMI